MVGEVVQERNVDCDCDKTTELGQAGKANTPKNIGSVRKYVGHKRSEKEVSVRAD